MNVIFTGQSGTNKENIIENLVAYIYKKYYPEEGRAGVKTNKFIRPYSLERYISSSKNGFSSWLQLADGSRQRKGWSEGFEKLCEAINKQNAKNNFISMHSVFYSRYKYFSPINWDQLRRLKPALFITFIDDIYDVWWRLKERQMVFPPSGMLRLRDVLTWRSAEIMVTDQIAKNLFKKVEIPHYVIAVKHPTEMLDKLLTQPDCMRVYASYPISRTRDFPEKRAIVDAHRTNLHNKFVVFDPLSIDERLLYFKYEQWKKCNPQPSTISILRGDRWPMPSKEFNFPLLAGPNQYPEIIEDINPLEIKEVIEAQGGSEVDGQVVWRDYRLIDQTHCLAAFRPSYGGYLSGGVNAEIAYAGLLGNNCPYQYVPKDDGSVGPFQVSGIVTDDYDKFIELLESHQRQIQVDHERPSHFSSMID